MTRWGSTFTAPALEWSIAPTELPVQGARRDGQPIGALVLFIATLWLALSLPPLLGDAPLRVVEPGRAGAWVGLGIGVALALWGLRILVRRQTIRIDRDGIHVRTRQLLGVTTWTEPLERYGGVVWRSEPIRRRGDRQTLHRIDLWHENPARTVTLLSSTSEAAARDGWKAWAKELGLAAIRLRAERAGFAGEAAKPLPSAP